jgi:hypothetical protein
MHSLLVRLLLGPALMLAFPASLLLAGGTVTNCSDDTQFSSLLAGGGTVIFNCGTALINLSNTQVISAGTTIDGSDRITLSGQNVRRLFVVSSGASLTLRKVVLTNGFSSGNGGAIYNGANGGDGGVLILESTTIRDSLASFSGGAIVSTGPLTITNSLLEGNRALNGGALYPRFSGAKTTIVNSVLRNNHATDTTNGYGGAILNWDGAPVTIEGSDIFGNSAQYGGAIYNFPNSSLTLNGGTIHDNTTFNDNGSVFNDHSGTATLSNVTLSGNSVNNSVGAGFYNYVGTATLTNVTLSGNSASNGSIGGGFANIFGSATLTNVSIGGNSANKGGGIYHFANAIGQILTLKNSIVANSPGGGNCFQEPLSLTSITSNGFNLSDDSSCASFFTLPSDRNNQDPLLGPLANNGGPTLTHLPHPGSPAIDHGSGCPPTDQRGAARPVGPACDIGAVEYGAILPLLYLPVISK